jgi:hypothetical protein
VPLRYFDCQFLIVPCTKYRLFLGIAANFSRHSFCTARSSPITHLEKVRIDQAFYTCFHADAVYFMTVSWVGRLSLISLHRASPVLHLRQHKFITLWPTASLMPL